MNRIRLTHNDSTGKDICFKWQTRPKSHTTPDAYHKHILMHTHTHAYTHTHTFTQHLFSHVGLCDRYVNNALHRQAEGQRDNETEKEKGTPTQT